jgi:hypothetical protein
MDRNLPRRDRRISCLSRVDGRAAGFDRFPTDPDGFLKLCQALKTNKTPAGFTFGKAPSDGNLVLPRDAMVARRLGDGRGGQGIA